MSLIVKPLERMIVPAVLLDLVVLISSVSGLDFVVLLSELHECFIERDRVHAIFR